MTRPSGLEDRSNSSILTSPTASPQMRASSPQNIAAVSLEVLTTNGFSLAQQTAGPVHAMTRQKSEYKCFNIHDNPRGHHFSAPQLHDRGIWVGYLAPDKQNQPYRELPSYHELKANWRKISHPFPDPNPSTSAFNREAVCRGCLGEDSVLLALRELSFAKGMSVVIMPLDGEDDIGMFCILLPQTLDRSVKNLQTWRPYEIRKSAESKELNDIILVTLRNTNRDVGTLDTVREILGCSASNTSSMVAPRVTQTIETHEQLDKSSSTTKKRSLQSYSEEFDGNVASKRTRTQTTEMPASRTQQSTPMSPRRTPRATITTPMTATPNTTTVSTMALTMPPTTKTPPIAGMSDEQAQNTYLVWSMSDDGYNYKLIHTMNECNTFHKLLKMLQGKCGFMSSAARLFKTSTPWRLSYSLPDGTREAVIAQEGSESAFDYLRTTLAQPFIWTGRMTMTVDLKAMA